MLSAIIATLLAPCLLVSAALLSGCSSDQFTCKDGGCINGTLKCDGVKDCKDGSDEIFNTCYSNNCNDENNFRCNYGGCVDDKLQCNGVYDCWDESDENAFLCANDTKLEALLIEMQGNCSSEYALQCKDDDKCLRWSQLCNGLADCPQNYDESEQLCSAGICPENSFRCESGACISTESLCNHEIECSDGSDEIPDICIMKAAAIEGIVYQNIHHDEIVNIWKTNSCPLTPNMGTHVVDYFSEFSYRADAEVPDKTIVAVTCDSGYEIIGPNINKCDSSKWLNEEIVCIRACNQSSDVRNVSYTTKCLINDEPVDCQQNTQTLNTELLVTCAPGYEANSGNSQVGRHKCNEQGAWTISHANPNCEPICGIKSPQHPGVTPWTVSIFNRDSSLEPNFRFKCFGTIISAYIVITAEHCFSNMLPANTHLYYSIAEGKHNVSFSNDEDHGYNLHNIMDIHVVTFNSEYMAAILTLVKPFSFGALVRPVCLTAEQAKADDGQIVKAGAFYTYQLGEGLTIYDNGRCTLTHIVASESFKYDIKAFISAIRNDIATTQRNP